MADHPDPTRRLRPLQESRARRRALLAPDADRPSSDAARPLSDAARPLSDADRPLSDADRPLADVGTAAAPSPTALPFPSPLRMIEGWVPSFTPDPADLALDRVPRDDVAARQPWTDGAHEPVDDARDGGGRDGDGRDGDGRAGRRHRHRALPGSAGGTTAGSRRRWALDRDSPGPVDDDRGVRGEPADDSSDSDSGFRFRADPGSHSDLERNSDSGRDRDGDGYGDGDDGVHRGRSPWAGLLRGGRRPWARWRERWVPDGVGPRVDPGRRGSALLSIVAVAAVLAAAFGALPSRGTAVGPSAVAVVDSSPTSLADASPGAGGLVPVPVGPVTPPAGGTPPPGETPPAAGEAAPPGISASAGPTVGPSEIVVAVTGGVRQPGVVTLVPGARVADAIAAAGGIVDGIDYTGLNLAAKLADGDSIVVGGGGQGVRSGAGTGAGGTGPGAGGAGAATSGETTTGPVDLNAADQATLETLPGVGPVMAGNIIDWRSANGGFTTVEELQEITGIGPARYATLAPLVRVG